MNISVKTSFPNTKCETTKIKKYCKQAFVTLVAIKPYFWDFSELFCHDWSLS